MADLNSFGAAPRPFGNPFSAWHLKALPRQAYYCDIDGADVVRKQPAILYEVKTISQGLYRAIAGGDESAQAVTDFWSRIDCFQLELIHNMRLAEAPRGAPADIPCLLHVGQNPPCRCDDPVPSEVPNNIAYRAHT